MNVKSSEFAKLPYYQWCPLVRSMTRQFSVVFMTAWDEEKAVEFTNKHKNRENEFIDMFQTNIECNDEDVDQMVRQFMHVIYISGLVRLKNLKIRENIGLAGKHTPTLIHFF